MKSSTEMVAVERPVVGTASQLAEYVSKATASGSLVRFTAATELSSGRYMMTATVRESRPVAPKLKRPTVAGEIGKALAFVGAVAAFVILAGTGIFLALSSALSGVNLSSIVGFGVILIVLGLLLVNRAGHSGACPGIAVHCKGCRH
jgi:hypothetical protein